MSQTITSGDRRLRPWGFVARTLYSFCVHLERTLYAEEIARRPGLLQGITPPVKTAALLLLLLDVALARNFYGIGLAFAVGLVLATGSRVPLRRMIKGPWLSALIFTGAIALPAVILTPGRVLGHLPWLGWPVTEQGVRAALYLIARVETALTFSVLLVLTTPWTQVLKSMSVLGMPSVVTVIVGMTHRYIFLLVHTSQDMFESRQSRTVGRMTGADQRRLAAAGAGVLLAKTHQLTGDVYLAMRSRGFRGRVYLLDEFRMRGRDWLAIGISLALLGLIFWAGHHEFSAWGWR